MPLSGNRPPDASQLVHWLFPGLSWPLQRLRTSSHKSLYIPVLIRIRNTVSMKGAEWLESPNKSFFPLPDFPHTKILQLGWRGSIAGRVVTLHVADLGLIPQHPI